MATRTDAVAALALIYRELYDAQHGAPDGCRIEGPEWLLDPLECNPGELTLLGMMGSQILGDVDWKILWAMEKNPECLPALCMEVAAVDPVRGEAMFNAWPSDAPQPGLWAGAYWRRRDEVRQAMDHLRSLGLTSSMLDVDLVADQVYSQETGRDPIEDFA